MKVVNKLPREMVVLSSVRPNLMFRWSVDVIYIKRNSEKTLVEQQ
jgi:hypothetical protein